MEERKERRDREDKVGLPNLDPAIEGKQRPAEQARGRSTSTDEISNPRPGER